MSKKEKRGRHQGLWQVYWEPPSGVDVHPGAGSQELVAYKVLRFANGMTVLAIIAADSCRDARDKVNEPLNWNGRMVAVSVSPKSDEWGDWGEGATEARRAEGWVWLRRE